ncbi:MAG: hypothetical protein MUO82_04655 [Candidatus Thermoplasmatota archaeon]|nr:hypothetical protein [Candidatus Thermoplasmatota archaeon]
MSILLIFNILLIGCQTQKSNNDNTNNSVDTDDDGYPDDEDDYPTDPNFHKKMSI